MTSRKNHGFSLLEMVIVIALGMTMAAVSVMTLMPLFRRDDVNQAYDTTLSVLRSYRNLAIAQSNRYIITFPTTGTIQVQLWGYSPPPAASPAPVTVATIPLPQTMQFAVQTGFPNPGPDSLGTGASPVYTQNTMTGAADACTVVASGNPCVIFYPDGSARDDQGTPGNYESVVVYMTQPANNAYSSRAIDIMGTTGRIRGWRLYNVSGTNTWEQQ